MHIFSINFPHAPLLLFAHFFETVPCLSAFRPSNFIARSNYCLLWKLLAFGLLWTSCSSWSSTCRFALLAKLRRVCQDNFTISLNANVLLWPQSMCHWLKRRARSRQSNVLVEYLSAHECFPVWFKLYCQHARHSYFSVSSICAYSSSVSFCFWCTKWVFQVLCLIGSDCGMWSGRCFGCCCCRRPMVFFVLEICKGSLVLQCFVLYLLLVLYNYFPCCCALSFAIAAHNARIMVYLFPCLHYFSFRFSVFGWWIL